MVQAKMKGSGNPKAAVDIPVKTEQDHTVVHFFFNRELLLFEKVEQCNSTTQKNTQWLCWEDAELCWVAGVFLSAEGRAATAVHPHSASDLV